MYDTSRKQDHVFYKIIVPCCMYDTSRKQDQVVL